MHFLLLRPPFLAFLVATISGFNAWIALFNLIPFGPFDGRKIFRWNIPVYLLLAAGALAFVILGYL